MSLALSISLGLAVTLAATFALAFVATILLDRLSKRFRCCDASDDLRQVAINQRFHNGASK
jgi:uncharacterized membrane protein